VLHTQYAAYLEAAEAAGLLSAKSARVVLLTAPLYHSYGLSVALEYISQGSTLVILPPAASVFAAARRVARSSSLAGTLTAIEGVPSVLEGLARLGIAEQTPAVRHIGFGGGRPGRALLKTLEAAFGPETSFGLRYGFTESPGAVAARNVQASQFETYLAGSVLPAYEVDVRRQSALFDGLDDTAGSLWIRSKGPCISLFSPDVVLDEEGYYDTGDIGYLDGDGGLHVVGRSSLLPHVRSQVIIVEEIEEKLRQLDCIEDCRVLVRGDELCIEVEPSSIDLERSVVTVRVTDALAHLSAAKKVFLVTSIPRTATGKIARREGA
jgi:acyl-CoA synthetase (AMP-forming)/AMP-acid ligase II